MDDASDYKCKLVSFCSSKRKEILIERNNKKEKKKNLYIALKVFFFPPKVCFQSDLLCLLSLFPKGDALAKRGYVMAILIVRISLMRIIARAICVDHQNTLVLMIPPSAYSLRSSAMGEEIVLMDLMKAIFVVLLSDTFF